MGQAAADRRVGRDGAARSARTDATRGSSPATRTKIFLLALGLIITVGVLTAPASLAHADLVSTDPASGSSLHPPAVITFKFSEAVTARSSQVTLLLPTGAIKSVTPGPGPSPSSYVAAVPATDGGPVTLKWVAIAADDGHVTSGQVRFNVEGAPAAALRTAAPGAARANTAGVQGGFAADRMLSYLAISILCGGLVFIALLWPAGAEVRRARRLLGAAWAVGIVTSLLGLGFEGATILQKPLLGIVAPSVMGKALTLQFGRVWAGKALLFVVAAPLLWALTAQGERAARSLAWRVGVAFVSVALVRTPGLVAHSQHGPHPDVGSVADLVHLAGAAAWIGGLFMLTIALLPRRDAQELATVIPRFSNLAAASVAAVAAAGAVLSWQLIGSWHALFETPFGHVLLLKLLAFGVLLGAAQMSRAWVLGKLRLARVLDGDAAVVRPFALSVGAETGLAVAVLLIASVLVNTNPVR